MSKKAFISQPETLHPLYRIPPLTYAFFCPGDIAASYQYANRSVNPC
ncbi:hypothetical protein DSUL_20069 [Desulfovibrionales bacterium]